MLGATGLDEKTLADTVAIIEAKETALRSTLRAPSNRSEAVIEEMIWAMSRLRLV